MPETPSDCSLEERLTRLHTAAEAIERVATDYHAAILPVREALQAVANVPLEDRDRWADAVSTLAQRLSAVGMAEVPASFEGIERWDRKFDAGDLGRAFAGQAFCKALAATIAGGTPDGFFATLHQHQFISDNAATREVCAVLSRLLYVHTERTAPQFTREYGKVLAEVGIDGETLQFRFRQCGLSLSTQAAAAISDWNECSSGVPFYPVDIVPHVEDTAATREPEKSEGGVPQAESHSTREAVGARPCTRTPVMSDAPQRRSAAVPSLLPSANTLEKSGDPRALHDAIIECVESYLSALDMIRPTPSNLCGDPGVEAALVSLTRLGTALARFPHRRLDPDPFALLGKAISLPLSGKDVTGTSLHDVWLRFVGRAYDTLRIVPKHIFTDPNTGESFVGTTSTGGHEYEKELREIISPTAHHLYTEEQLGERIKIQCLAPPDHFHFTELPWDDAVWQTVRRILIDQSVEFHEGRLPPAPYRTLDQILPHLNVEYTHAIRHPLPRGLTEKSEGGVLHTGSHPTREAVCARARTRTPGMPDSGTMPNPDFLSTYTRERDEAEREATAVRTAFEARVSGPARQLRPEWDAAWSDLCRLLGPVWSAVRREPSRGPLPEPSLLAAALKAVGESLARLDPIREARLEINPTLHEFSLQQRSIPPRPTDRLTRVRDDKRFLTPAPRAAAELLVRAVYDSTEDLTGRVRALLADEVLRVAFGWLPFMRDCIWPQPAPRRPGPIQECAHREDPFGAGPACNDWRQQIHGDDYRRAEILLTGEVPIFNCELFPEWHPETPAPSTVGELRAHCLSERNLLPCWNWSNDDYDYGPKLLPLWEHVVRVAGGRPYPPLGEGRYDLVRAQAAIDRVVQWCDERMGEEPAASAGGRLEQTDPFPLSSSGKNPLVPASTETKQSEGEAPPADVNGLVRRFRCYNCAPPHEFASELPVCPECSADARRPIEHDYIVPLVTIHFDPPHAVLRGRGQGIMACRGESWPPGTSVSGETAVVTCSACRETEAFQVAESEQHPHDATDRVRKRVDDLVSALHVVPSPGPDTELADAFSAVATGIRECTRLMASIPSLWTDEDGYCRLAARVADAATAARDAYRTVDIRLRRLGGPNPMLEALTVVLTVQGRAPLDPTGTPGGLNAILTNLYTRRAELFSRADGRGYIDRMLDQLARVPLATNTPAAADPLPVVTAPTPNGTKQGEGGATKPAAPFIPLTSWNDILAALNEPHGEAVWKNNEQTRDKIRKLNSEHNGPIKFPQGKGKQPSVDKAALVAWWNSLRDHFDARNDEEKAEAESARLTVADSHNYGTSGKVVPGIGGSEKRTRAKSDENGKEGKR
jgi:hypothetical protein